MFRIFSMPLNIKHSLHQEVPWLFLECSICCLIWCIRSWTRQWKKKSSSTQEILLLRWKNISGKTFVQSRELFLWDTHNPDSLILISTVSTFEFYAESAWSLDFWFPQFLFSFIGWAPNSLASDFLLISHAQTTLTRDIE